MSLSVARGRTIKLDLADDIQEINDHHKLAMVAGKEVLVQAFAAGAKLMELKKKCKHGKFEELIEEQFDFSVRTAQHYMKLARGEDDIRERIGPGNAATLTVTEGIRMLCSQSSPKKGDQKRNGVALLETEDYSECPHGGEHEYDEEACIRCHDPKPEDNAVPSQDSRPGGGAGLSGNKGMEAAGQNKAGDGSSVAAERLFFRADQLYGVLVRLLDEIHEAEGPSEMHQRAIDHLNLSHMELNAWRKSSE